MRTRLKQVCVLLRTSINIHRRDYTSQGMMSGGSLVIIEIDRICCWCSLGLLNRECHLIRREAPTTA